MDPLSYDEILSEGASLWILPSATDCSVATEIDWYLNFQIAHSKMRNPRPVSEELLKIAEENDIEIMDRPLGEKPLMIAGAQALPVEQIVEILSASPLEWLKQSLSVWADLGKPPVRVFLPRGTSYEQFKKLWANYISESVQVFVDPVEAS